MTAPRPDPAIEVGGEQLLLLRERAVYWPGRRTLFVADLHFGKAAAFRSAGVLVPHGTTHGTLARLDATLTRTGATRLVFLGDLLHSREGRVPMTMDALHAWRRGHDGVEMLLVRGNHDGRAGDPPASLQIACIDEPHVAGPFVLAHHPAGSEAGYVLAGHLHPGVRLAGPGRERARLPCFWFGARVGVLPAFGEFTGLGDVSPAPGDRIWVAAGDAVVAIPA